MTLRRPKQTAFADRVYEGLHAVMGWLALMFIVIVVGDNVVADESPFDTIFTVSTWVIWGVFAAEYVARLIIAPSAMRFLARTWWQLVILVLPFLGFLRLIAATRVARAGRAVSAAIRTTRSAARALSNRIAWVGAVTAVVILLATDLLYEFGDVHPYIKALHDVALGAISGEPIPSDAGIAQVLDIVLALYSVVVFATLAGALGAFFFDRQVDDGAG